MTIISLAIAAESELQEEDSDEEPSSQEARPVLLQKMKSQQPPVPREIQLVLPR